MIDPNTCTVDLHLHTTISDGTDTPEQLLKKVRAEGIGFFSITDHDDVKGCTQIHRMISDDDPAFITGVEFNSRDDEGRYHILGYGYDPASESILKVVRAGHEMRMKKVTVRLEGLERQFGFSFPAEEIDELMALNNPGKPHIANLMVKHGYAQTKDAAIKDHINRIKTPAAHLSPREVIDGIKGAGGICILAHPPYGSGDDMILNDELEERIKRLVSMGLSGVEGFYSGYTHLMRDQVLGIAEKYDLYVSAGSDYHGTNKLVMLGDTGLDGAKRPRGLLRFLEKAASLVQIR